MKEFDVQSIVKRYSSIAKLKDEQVINQFGATDIPKISKNVATHIFGAQQIAWLCWSECEIKVDIMKVNTLLACCPINVLYLPFELKQYRSEFFAKNTKEAKFANLCIELEELIQNTDISAFTQSVKFIKEKYANLILQNGVDMNKFKQLCEEMKNWRNIVDTKVIATELKRFIDTNYPEFGIEYDSLKTIVARYCIISELKDKTRQGWNYWNVDVPHREVVSEHAYGTQPLAWLIYLESGNVIDIKKVVAMMSLHETEESIMQDFTPYDPVTSVEILEMGKLAVEVVFGELKEQDMFINLLDEFNAKVTAEGKFAYFCDKLECLFRIKMYSDLKLCSIEGGCELVKNDPEIKENIKKGAKSVAELFMMHEMPKFKGTIFADITNCLKEYDTSK